MAAKKSSPVARFVVYVFTSIVAPIVVSVVSGSIKDNKLDSVRPAAPAVTLLPPAPEPSIWETYYRPNDRNSTTTTAQRHDGKN